MLLPTAYLPPVSYAACMVREGSVTLEAHEHFIKQTIRSRCAIAGANGPLFLSVPVAHSNRWRTKIKDLRIADDQLWQKVHLKSIRSSYGKAPFFEYYFDELEAVLSKKQDFLFDLNYALLDLTCSYLKQRISFSESIEYTEPGQYEKDLRSAWNQDNAAGRMTPEYYQVFTDKHGFLRDLSILDLLMNTGPEAMDILKKHP